MIGGFLFPTLERGKQSAGGGGFSGYHAAHGTQGVGDSEVISTLEGFSFPCSSVGMQPLTLQRRYYSYRGVSSLLLRADGLTGTLERGF